MRYIGFENFRKFQSFPKIEFGDITFLVGGNSAGKSTMLYALMIIYDNLRGMHIDRTNSEDEREEKPLQNIFDVMNPLFVFSSRVNSDLWMKFEDVIFNKSKEPVISFDFGIDDFDFLIKVEQRDFQQTYAKVKYMSITDIKNNIKIEIDFNPENPELTYSFNMDEDNPDSTTMVKSKIINYDIAYGNEKSIIFYIRNSVDSIQYDYEQKYVEYNNIVLNHTKDINSMLERLENTLENRLEYIPLYITNKETVYEESSLIYRVINRIFPFQLNRFGDMRNLNLRKFNDKINRWMKMFEIGDYVNIKYNGTLVDIRIREGDTYVKLKNLGSGARHIFILLLWVQYISLDNKQATIIVEEPEQNLHPKLQSKLADLFWELNKEYGVQFIVETHSEYLIRRSQYLVAKHYGTPYKLIRENPFKVYYFSEKNGPYDMGYKTDGFFKRPFERGFFDESTRLYNDTIKVREHE